MHLKTHIAEVDIDGYDIILDNGDLLGKYQLKSKFDSTTSTWEIHSVMLKPNMFVFDSFEFTSPNGCPNDERGVILIDANLEGDRIVCKYSYTDIYILRALELGLIKTTTQSLTKATELLTELRNERKDKVSVISSLSAFKESRFFTVHYGFPLNSSYEHFLQYSQFIKNYRRNIREALC